MQNQSCCGRDMACVAVNYTAPLNRQYRCEVCGQSRSVDDPVPPPITLEELRERLRREGRTICDRDGNPLPMI